MIDIGAKFSGPRVQWTLKQNTIWNMQCFFENSSCLLDEAV